MQLAQSQVFCAQNPKHFSPSTYHLSAPPAFDAFKGSSVRSPQLMAFAGQLSAHLLQTLQNSATPDPVRVGRY
jgi:hypothetical protein